MIDDGSQETEPYGVDDGHPGTYHAPTLQRLGTLEELTLGNFTGPDDGLGGGLGAS